MNSSTPFPRGSHAEAQYGARVATDLIIFDCDGVLVDSEILSIEIGTALLNTAGFDLTADSIADRFVGMSYHDMMRLIEIDFGRPIPPGLSERIQRDTMASFPDRLAAVVGVEQLLSDLGPARCVASSSNLDRVQLSLDITGLARFFDPAHVYSAQMVRNGKPAPDLFLHAAEQLRTDPAACLVVEDSPHGVAAARAAGMNAVGFVGGRHARPSLASRLEEAGAVAVVDSPDQILRYV